jgi:hypothetical protein
MNDDIQAPGWMAALLAFLLFGIAGTIAAFALVSFLSDSNPGWWTP